MELITLIVLSWILSWGACMAGNDLQNKKQCWGTICFSFCSPCVCCELLLFQYLGSISGYRRKLAAWEKGEVRNPSHLSRQHIPRTAPKQQPKSHHHFTFGYIRFQQLQKGFNWGVRAAYEGQETKSAASAHTYPSSTPPRCCCDAAHLHHVLITDNAIYSVSFSATISL